MVLEFKAAIKYRETFVPGKREPLTVLNNLLQAGIISKYVFYEDRDEVRIAGNELAKVLVTKEQVLLEGIEQSTTEIVNDPLKQVEKLLNSLSLENWTAYGYVAFDLARFYSSYSKSIAEPLCYFLIPETELHFTKEGVRIKTTQSLEQVREQLFVDSQLPSYTSTSLTIDESDREHYQNIVSEMIEAVQQSYLHKAIISRPRQILGQLDVLGTYTIGSQANNAARSYCLDLADVQAVGFSPETLMEVNEEGFVTTNPLAGTKPRGASIEEDIKFNNQLFTDAKEVKEHSLSIWLAQNEIASVCLPETIQIFNFMEVKKYRCVQHLSSRVGGQLQSDKTLWDALKVLFPGITVSGINKYKALEWIDRLENEPRGLYAGAIGWVDSRGKADLALSLRSVYQYGDRVCLNAGAGIIAESVPQNEYIESVNKMNTMLNNLVLTTK
ncbi:Chorismate binding domain protein [Hyella patelloides LEGE 07179]|uniref:Chorismate binding domain protein n=1 Tax=Hyella patelloides LEGE 07179 TaxID=945734 RepID=A0A563W1K8_9CYAN|nr:salicylate synthase [Hyella patelloides]VEP17561.1 Chorismate binding domain protein [Hyella patelloides LEGE 07179]